MRTAKSERGIALPLTLLLMAVCAGLVAASLEYSSSASRGAAVSQDKNRAGSLAEAGINNALAVLNYWDGSTMKNNAFDPTLLGCDTAGQNCTPFVTTYGDGTATWYGVLDATLARWTIYSTGEVPNPTGGAPLKDASMAKVPVTWNNSQPANAVAWNYIYSTRPPGIGCELDFEPGNNGGTIVVDIPLYVTGDLCFNSNNASIDEQGEGQIPAPQPVDIRVGGRIAYVKGGTVGVVSDPVTSASAVGGCSTSTTGATHPCTAPGDRFYADSQPPFIPIEAPTADFSSGATSQYATASPGPKHPCTVASNPSSLPATTFESVGNTLSDASAATFDLTPATSYQCKTYHNDDPSGPLIGELSWDAATHLLTVRGKIFIDGSVTSADATASYNGTGSIYIGGTFTLSGQLCSTNPCDFTNWDPNVEMLMLVANGAGYAFTFSGSNKFQGSIFCNPTATINFSANNTDIQGPIVCGAMKFSNGIRFKPLPAITALPLGTPGNPNVHAKPGTPIYDG
jgi:hypothetical protein